jgi:hypothetical protein
MKTNNTRKSVSEATPEQQRAALTKNRAAAAAKQPGAAPAQSPAPAAAASPATAGSDPIAGKIAGQAAPKYSGNPQLGTLGKIGKGVLQGAAALGSDTADKAVRGIDALGKNNPAAGAATTAAGATAGGAGTPGAAKPDPMAPVGGTTAPAHAAAPVADTGLFADPATFTAAWDKFIKDPNSSAGSLNAAGGKFDLSVNRELLGLFQHMYSQAGGVMKESRFIAKRNMLIENIIRREPIYESSYNASRMLVEAALTQDQIQQIFAAVADGAKAGGNVANADAGGLYILDESTGSLTGVDIRDNTAARGAGLLVDDADLTVSGGTISDNAATAWGGGLWMPGYGRVTLAAVPFSGNTPDEVYAGAAVVVGPVATTVCEGGGCAP